MVIIWLNGGFAAGKTTLAQELHRRLPDAVPVLCLVGAAAVAIREIGLLLAVAAGRGRPAALDRPRRVRRRRQRARGRGAHPAR